jgi:hypothetical protein
MNAFIANDVVISIEIIRSDGTREFLGTVSSSKVDDDNNSSDKFSKE